MKTTKKIGKTEFIKLGTVPFVKAKDMTEAIKDCGFRESPNWQIDDKSFPWRQPRRPDFEAQLASFPIHPYLFELQEDDKFKLPAGWVHASHIHLISYHRMLPEEYRPKKQIVAAGFVGRTSGGSRQEVLTLLGDGRGGSRLVRGDDTGLDDEWVETPYRRILYLHLWRKYFDDCHFLIVRKDARKSGSGR